METTAVPTFFENNTHVVFFEDDSLKAPARTGFIVERIANVYHVRDAMGELHAASITATFLY